MDADLHHPTIHQLFGIESEPGLTSVLAGRADPMDAICESGISGLAILPHGSLSAPQRELLATPRFPELLDVLRERYDFVLLDTPAVLAVSDVTAVAARVDGVLFALQLACSSRPAAERAVQALAAVGATFLGVIVTGDLPRTRTARSDRGNLASPQLGTSFPADYIPAV